jgi:RNA polymerase sigma factor (sigma-70 family)
VPIQPVREQFDRTFLGLMPRLHRRAVALSGSAHLAEDAVQDAYVKLVGRPDRLTRHPLPYAYALTAVVSLLRDGWRRRRREVPAGDLFDSVPHPRPSTKDAKDAELEAVRLLKLLAASQAAAVALVDLDGYTIDQAAAVLGVHRGTVSRSRVRALERLRRALSTEDSGSDGRRGHVNPARARAR